MGEPKPKHAGITWEERSALLEEALRALPIKRNESAKGIPYVFLIPGIVRELLLMTPIAPKTKLRSPKKGLHCLMQSSEDVVEVLDKLPQSAVDVLNLRPKALRALKASLRILSLKAQQAILDAGEVDTISRRGAPKKAQPRRIAQAVALHYFGLTGTKPTVPKKEGVAYGRFLNLLRRVFEILGVSASPESQAEEVSRNWTSTTGNFDFAGMELNERNVTT